MTNWTLLDEFGLDYSKPDSSNSRRLSWPVFAERSHDGGYWILDERATEKSVPIRAEFQTIRLGEDGNGIAPPHEGVLRRIDNDLSALLLPVRWELRLLSQRGSTLEKIDLSRISKRVPAVLTITKRRTLLMAFVDRVFEVDFAELDLNGQVIWHFSNKDALFGCPSGIQLLDNDHLLVVDEFCHFAVEIDREGNTFWTYGKRLDPGSSLDRLSAPRGIRQNRDGFRFIADTRNHRILSIDPRNNVHLVNSPDADFNSPTHAEPSDDGHLLICDAGNGRIIELDPNGNSAWSSDAPLTKKRWLSFPRSVEMTRSGSLLVADTANDRIVEIRDRVIRELALREDIGLFWPRCAIETPSDTLVIADGRNSRIIEVSLKDRALRQLDRIEANGGLPLKDPHDVRLLPNGHLLIVDAPSGYVAEADWQGRAYRIVGIDGSLRLKDPHSAQAIGDGGLLIADSGNHRIIEIEGDGGVAREWKALRSERYWYPLNRPRFALRAIDGSTIVVDTGNNRLLAVDPSNRLMWELSSVPGSPIPRFDQPRWVCMPNPFEMLVGDHCHHRIVRLLRQPIDARSEIDDSDEGIIGPREKARFTVTPTMNRSSSETRPAIPPLEPESLRLSADRESSLSDASNVADHRATDQRRAAPKNRPISVPFAL